MKIWIIHQHAIPPSRPGHTRPYDYARALQKLGHEVYIISSDFNHVKKIHEWLRPGEKHGLINCDDVQFLWLPTPGYSGNTIGRVWDMLVFGLRIFARTGQHLLPTPDVIIGSSPPPFGVLAGSVLAKRIGARFILDIRDLWPETLMQLGNYSRFNPLVIVLGLTEKWLYRRADYVITVLPDAVEYMASKGAKRERIAWLPNGVAMDLVPEFHLTERENSAFTVMYAGAHGIANGLESIVRAAEILQRKGYSEKDILFRLIGDGPEKPKLMQLMEKLSLRNVIFDKPVSKKDIFSILHSADVLIVTLKDITLYKYGMSLNKVHDYMAVGRPIIFGARLAKNPVVEAHAGISVPPEDSIAMANAVENLKDLTLDERRIMGQSGRNYVITNHDMRMLAKRLDGILNNFADHNR